MTDQPTYQPLTPEGYRTAPSETAKYRHIVQRWCREPGGVDIGSQGAVVFPWAISFDLPEEEFLKYSGGNPPKGPIDVRGHLDALPFPDLSIPWIYCSHVLEDFERRQWIPIFRHWASKVRSGGHIVVLVPERKLWWDYVKRGGVHNFSHTPSGEPLLGDIGTAAKAAGLVIDVEKLTECYEGDFTILGVVRCP